MNFTIIKALFLELLKQFGNWVIWPTFGKALEWLNLFNVGRSLLFEISILENESLQCIENHNRQRFHRKI